MRNGGFPTAIGLLVLVAILAPHPARTAPLRDGDDDGQYFRPPTIPFATFAPMHQKHVLATSTAATSLQKGASTKYWLGQDMPIGLALRFGASGVVPLLGGDVWPTASSRGGQTHCDDWRLGSGIDFIWVGVQPKAADVGPLITRLGYDVYVVDLRHACSDRCSFDALHLCEQGATLMARANVSTYHKAIDEEFIMIQPIVMVDIHVDLIGITEPVSVYMDFGAQNAIHLFEKANASEEVTWKTGNTTVSGAQWASLGTVKQPVLESCGDLFMLDWGYGYIGSYSPNAITTGGHTMNTTRALFSSTGQLPPTLTSPTSRAAFDPQTGDVVATAVMEDISSSRHTTFFIGYDEGPIMDYFGEKILPRWSRNGTISYLDALDAMTQRSGLIPHMEVLQEQLEGSFSALGGRYQRIANMAYRQTAAAIEFGYSDLIGRDVAFLKEISTDGDINTMDVIFPASPMLIFLSGNTLKELLIPVLHFAANLTSHPYSSPYSPHQLGIYPIANATTASQEVMPLENTGNMIVMIQALTNGNPGETFYFKPWDNKTKYNPYWGVLSHWVDYLMTTQLPDPPKQTTTDDFAGPLDHDVNLAGKGVIAVHAFGELCKMAAGDVNPANGRPCSDYTAAAEGFAKFWVEHATETDLDTGLTYTKLAFDQNRTWSTKYNLVWQRLLKNATRYETDGVFGRHPFATLNATAANEVRLYETRFNEYGYPLDSRHSYQKLDWLTWGACLCRTQSCFLRFFDGVYRMANQTAERYPLTDLYNTHHATMVYAFVSRPVVGAVFMPLLLDWDRE